MRHIPNLITLVRLILVFPVGFYIYRHWPLSDFWPALAVYLLALTDWIDGALARFMQIESEFGAWIDPMADKAFTLSIGGAVCFGAGLAWWAVVPFLAISLRDLSMSLMRTSPERAKAIPVSSLAKQKTLVCMFALLGMVLPQSLGLFWVALVLYWVAAGLSLWTAWHYLRH